MTGDWSYRAACAGADDIWHPVDHYYEEARAVCDACPVKIECLAAAFDIEGLTAATQYRHGMWGGLTPAERAERARLGVVT